MIILLVPAYPGRPGKGRVKQLLLVMVKSRNFVCYKSVGTMLDDCLCVFVQDVDIASQLVQLGHAVYVDAPQSAGPASYSQVNGDAPH